MQEVLVTLMIRNPEVLIRITIPARVNLQVNADASRAKMVMEGGARRCSNTSLRWQYVLLYVKRDNITSATNFRRLGRAEDIVSA